MGHRDAKERPSLRIRVISLDDLPAVFHLGERLFTSSEVPNLYHSWDEHEVVARFQEDRDLSLVALHGDQVVGFLLGTTVSKPRSSWRYGYLEWLGVDPSHQRNGVARRLFERWRTRLLEGEGVNMLLVDTEADNEMALRFFRRMGFTNPEPHVYMSLNLSSERKLLNGEAKRRGQG
jgi:ribosomal protein S18 acetylase RimI-like enzyme